MSGPDGPGPVVPGRGRGVLRAAGTAVLAVAAAVVAVLAWQHGVRTSDFPTAAGPTPVAGTYYSGPWVLLAVAAGGLAAVLLVRLASGLVGARRAG